MRRLRIFAGAQPSPQAIGVTGLLGRSDSGLSGKAREQSDTVANEVVGAITPPGWHTAIPGSLPRGPAPGIAVCQVPQSPVSTGS
ncbi:MAG: hypothetical protein V2G44_08920 [bacterium JZ-2024 1]